jgi:hypothetical protein
VRDQPLSQAGTRTAYERALVHSSRLPRGHAAASESWDGCRFPTIRAR